MNKTELVTLISNVRSQCEEQGVTGVIITSYVKAIKSWARFNGKEMDEKVNMPESESSYDQMLPSSIHPRIFNINFKEKWGCVVRGEAVVIISEDRLGGRST